MGSALVQRLPQQNRTKKLRFPSTGLTKVTSSITSRQHPYRDLQSEVGCGLPWMGPSQPASPAENGSPLARSPLSLCGLRSVLRGVNPASPLLPLCSSASPRTDLPMGSWRLVDGRGWGRADSRSSVRQIKSDTRDLGKSDWDVMQSRWMGRGEKRE